MITRTWSLTANRLPAPRSRPVLRHETPAHGPAGAVSRPALRRRGLLRDRDCLYAIAMRRWLLLTLTLTPAVLVIGHVAGVLAVEEIKGGTDDYFALIMFLVEVFGGTAAGYWLARRGTLPPHAPWSLPFGIAAGFLPWLFLASTGNVRLGGLLPYVVIWAFAVTVLGLLVTPLRDRIRPMAVLIAAFGGVALHVLLPYLAARAQLGPDPAPYSSATDWAIQSTIHPDGFGASQRLASGYATILAMVVVLGTTVYLGSLFGNRKESSSIESGASPTPDGAEAENVGAPVG
jgi:hypothetical protein